MNDLLLLTHTNPHDDSRIMKYHNAAQRAQMSVQVIGLVRGGEKIASDTVLTLSSRLRVSENKLTRVRIKHFRTVMSAPYYFSIFLQLIYRGLKNRSRVIHANDQFTLPSAYILKLLTGAKLVYDAHELESEANGVSKLMRRATILIEKISWNQIDLFVTVSESIKSWYISRFGIKKAEVILNSPERKKDSPKFKEIDSNYFRKKYGIPDSSRIFLYLGALETGRGIHIYLDALQITTCPITIILMGKGSLEDKIRSHPNFGNNLFLHEPVDHSSIIDYASSADFGLCLIERVSLSDWMCLPNKLFEYLFSGIPVITSDFPELSRVVSSHSVGVAIAPTLGNFLHLLEQPNLITTEFGELEMTSLDKYSWESQETIAIEMYKSLGCLGDPSYS